MQTALRSQGSSADQVAHFHKSKGAVAILDALLTGALDIEAKDVLGEGSMQEVDQLEDYMPRLELEPTDG